MAAPEEEIVLEDDEEEDEDEEEGFNDLIEVLNVSEEAVVALQDSEEGVELLQAMTTYLRKKGQDDQQYEDALLAYQESAEQSENEYRSLQADFTAQGQQLERLQTEHLNCGSELAVLRERAAASAAEARERMDRLEAALAEKEASLAVLQGELQALREARDAAQRPPPEVPGDRYELLKLLDRRQLEATRLGRELDAQNHLLDAATDTKQQLQEKVDDLTTQVSSVKLKEQMLTQERLMLENRVKWLTEELTSKSDLVHKTKLESGQQVSTLQHSLKAEEEARKEGQEELKRVRDLRATVEKKLEANSKELLQQREENIDLENHFRKELSAQSKLLELYQSGSRESQTKLEEMVKVVEGLQVALATTSSEREQALQEVAQQQQQLQRMEAEVIILRSSTTARLAASEPEPTATTGGAGLSGRGLAEEMEEVEHDGGPGPGLTMSQVYDRFAAAQRELQTTREENQRLASCLEEIRQDLESKGPVIYRLKREHDGAVAARQQLRAQAAALHSDCDQLRLQVEDGFEALKAKDLECTKYKHVCKDLRQQVQTLLKEVEEGQGGVVSTSFGLPRDIEDDPNISSSDEVISKRLVTFKSLSELQVRNEELLAVVRELSSHNEKMEAELSSEGVKELRSKLASATCELTSLQESRDRQKEMVEAIVRQRDMYKILAAETAQGPMDVSRDRPMSSSSRPRTPAAMTTVPVGVVSSSPSPSQDQQLLPESPQELDTRFQDYRRERAENERMLQKQVEEMRESLSLLNMEKARLQAKLEYGGERQRSLEAGQAALQSELSLLRERRAQQSSTSDRHLSTVERLTADLLQARTLQAKHEFELQSLREERSVLSRSEERARQQYETLLRGQGSQQLVLSNLQSLRSCVERRGEEERGRSEERLLGLERELLLARTRADMEEQRCTQTTESFRAQLSDLRDELANERQTHLTTGDQMTEKAELVVAKETEIEGLKKALTESEDKVRAVEVQLAEVQTDPSSELKRAQRLLERRLAEEEASCRALKEQLAAAEKNAEQYRSMNAANEAALRELNSSSQQFTAEVEAKLEQANATVSSLTDSLSSEKERREREEQEASEKEQSLQEQARELQSRLSSLEGQCSEYVAQRDRAVADRAEAVADQERLQRDNEQVQLLYNQELVRHGNVVGTATKLKDEASSLKLRLQALEAESEQSRTRQQEMEASHQTKMAALSVERDRLQGEVEELVRQNSLLHGQAERLSSQLVTEQAVSRVGGASSVAVDDGSSMVSMSSIISVGTESSQENAWEIVRFVRREKEIAEARAEMTGAELSRLRQRTDHLAQQLQEAELLLRQERERSEVATVTAEQHADILSKLESFNLLRDSNRLMREEKQETETKVAGLEEDVRRLERDAGPLRESNRGLASQKDALVAESTALKNEVSRWQTRTTQLIEQYNKVDPEEYRLLLSMRDATEATLTALKASVSQLEADKTEIQTKCQALEQANKEHLESLTSLRSELQSLQGSLEDKDKQIREKEAMNKKLKDIGKNFRDRYQTTKKELEDLRTSTEQADSEGSRAQDRRVAGLEERASSAEAARTEAEARVEGLRGRLEELENSIVEKDMRDKEVKKTIGILKERWSKSKTKVDELKTQTSELEKKLQLSTQAAEEAAEDAQRVAQLERRLAQLEEELRDLRSQDPAPSEALLPLPTPVVTTTTPTATVKPTSVVGTATPTNRGKTIAQAVPVASVSPSLAAKQRVAIATSTPQAVVPPSHPGGPSIGTAIKIVRSVSLSPVLSSQVVHVTPQAAPSTSSEPTRQAAVSSGGGPSQSRKLKRSRPQLQEVESQDPAPWSQDPSSGPLPSSKRARPGQTSTAQLQEADQQVGGAYDQVGVVDEYTREPLDRVSGGQDVSADQGGVSQDSVPSDQSVEQQVDEMGVAPDQVGVAPDQVGVSVEGVDQEPEQTIDDQEGVADDQGEGDDNEMEVDQEGVADDQEGMADDQEGVADDQEGVADDQESMADDQEGVVDDQEGVVDDQEGVSDNPPDYQEDSTDEDMADDQVGVTDDQEGMVNDQVGVADDQEGVADEEGGVSDDEEGVADQAGDEEGLPSEDQHVVMIQQTESTIDQDSQDVGGDVEEGEIESEEDTADMDEMVAPGNQMGGVIDETSVGSAIQLSSGDEEEEEDFSEEGEVGTDEEVEVEATSDITTVVAQPRLGMQTRGGAEVMSSGGPTPRPPFLSLQSVPGGEGCQGDATVPQTPDFGQPKVPGSKPAQTIPSPTTENPPIGSSAGLQGMSSAAEADSSQEGGLSSLGETNVDFGIPQKLGKPGGIPSSDRVVPTDENSDRKGEEPGESGVGSSSQQPGPARQGEKGKNLKKIVFDLRDSKPPSKPASKPPSKPAAKPAAKPASKPAAKPASKPPTAKRGGRGRGRGRGRARGSIL